MTDVESQQDRFITVQDYDGVRREYTLVTVRDYDGLERALRFTPASKPSKLIVVEFIESNGNALHNQTRYIVPPQYREDGSCYCQAHEFVYDQATKKWETYGYCDDVAKHVIRVKQANGCDYPLIIYNIKIRDLKDELFMRGVLFDEWEPYLMREKAK